MENLSTVTEFILIQFSEIRELQILYFVVFLSIYLVALLGNFLIILTVIHEHNLHSPMYFFLANLSLTDACYISTTVPKSMAVSLTNNRAISFGESVCQVFLLLTFAGAELAFLIVMAYDRYVAICHPLQYMTIMNWHACLQMAAASWVSSVIYAIVHTISTFRLHFCSSNIKQFFCDIPQLWIISCTDTALNEWLVVAAILTVGSFCLFFILISYGQIFSAVLKIRSSQGRRKVFSTCTPHLTMFSLFLTTIIFSYLRPKTLSSPSVDLLASVFYTVLPPLMNPIIYSLRNKEIHRAAQKMANKWPVLCGVISNTFLKNVRFSAKRKQLHD